MRRAVSATVWPVARPAGTMNGYRPCSLVYVPTPGVGMEQLTPCTGTLVSLRTRPLTVVACWAPARMGHAPTSTAARASIRTAMLDMTAFPCLDKVNEQTRPTGGRTRD